MKNLESLSLKVTNGQLLILDQQMLPDQENWIMVESPEHMVSIIKELKVRGAPLIGVAASIALALSVDAETTTEAYLADAESLRQSRPTAVNLMNALDRMVTMAEAENMDLAKIHEQAEAIFEEDVKLCLDMAKAGQSLIDDGDNILTHCNTGGLATVGVGTALGVITEAHRAGKNIHVYVDETRPLLQGGRLTTWELEKAGVPYTLICDNMAASLMRGGHINKVFLGADRIATNGDFANKIGTYSLAVLCKHHDVPFYTVAPKTTIDPQCESGDAIPVELRKDEEVRGVFGHFGEIRWAPRESKTFNPAFDVTPFDLLTGMIIDNKVYDQKMISSGQLKTIF